MFCLHLAFCRLDLCVILTLLLGHWNMVEFSCSFPSPETLFYRTVLWILFLNLFCVLSRGLPEGWCRKVGFSFSYFSLLMSLSRRVSCIFYISCSLVSYLRYWPGCCQEALSCPLHHHAAHYTSVDSNATAWTLFLWRSPWGLKKRHSSKILIIAVFSLFWRWKFLCCSPPQKKIRWLLRHALALN